MLLLKCGISKNLSDRKTLATEKGWVVTRGGGQGVWAKWVKGVKMCKPPPVKRSSDVTYSPVMTVNNCAAHVTVAKRPDLKSSQHTKKQICNSLW